MTIEEKLIEKLTKALKRIDRESGRSLLEKEIYKHRARRAIQALLTLNPSDFVHATEVCDLRWKDNYSR